MSTWYILTILSPNPSFSGFWKSPSFSPPLASVPFLVKLLSWFLCVFPISKCWSNLQDLVPSSSTASGKESTCNAGNTGDLGLIPGSGRSPGWGNGNPPQYSCLENPMEWGAWGHKGSQRVRHEHEHGWTAQVMSTRPMILNIKCILMTPIWWHQTRCLHGAPDSCCSLLAQ